MKHDMRPVAEAYRLMAVNDYRPAAPSDGLGNITGPLNLEREIERYCARWSEEEDSLDYRIGVGNFSTMVPLVLCIEAARLLCAGSTGNKLGLKLLRLAVHLLDEEVSS
jgi:hypothetical protein